MRVAVVALLLSSFLGGTACRTVVVREADDLQGARLRPPVSGRRPSSFEVAAHGATLRGVTAVAPGSRLVLVYFGGDAEIVDSSSPIVRLAARHGMDLYAVNYPGFGPSEGRASFEEIAGAALAVLDHVAPLAAARGQKVVLYGYSLGTIVALRTALERRVAAVVLEAPPTDAAAAIPRLERSRPDAALALPDLQPLMLVRRLEPPLLVLCGTRDQLIPPRMAREVVAAAASARKTFCAVPGAGHDDLWRAYAEAGDACLAPFLREIAPQHRNEQHRLEVMERSSQQQREADGVIWALCPGDDDEEAESEWRRGGDRNPPRNPGLTPPPAAWPNPRQGGTHA